MGGAVSSGEDNADLIDKLVEGDYIKDALVEKVFRAVDRGDYFLPDQRSHAYKDQAWKHGNVHLSAPCIYAEVMEWLKLEPGLSFLNLGSGTGYLSTMAGLILGPYGVNHGVEYHQDVIEYAEERLDNFIQSNEAFDEFEFCPPSFVRGNCLSLSPTCRLYSRVYCGAACPTEHENYMKNLVEIGGILVMPLNDQLVQVTRTSETQWDTKMILPVSFARLIQPPNREQDVEFSSDEGGGVRFRVLQEMKALTADLIELPNVKVMSLMEISRLIIRRVLLQNIRAEHPNISRKRPRKSKKRRQPPAKQRRINLVPTETGLMFVGQFSDDSDLENAREGEEQDRDHAAERDRAREANVREMTRGDQLRNSLLARLFGPRLMFLPLDFGQDSAETEATNHMEAEAGPEAEAGLEPEQNSNDVQDDSIAEAMPDKTWKMAEEPMHDADTEDSDLSNELMPAKMPGENQTSQAEEKSDVNFDVAAACDDELVAETVSTAVSTTTAVSDASISNPAAPAAAAVTAPCSSEAANSSSLDRSAFYSSGVETCSSIEADFVETDDQSSIFWTQEFQNESQTESKGESRGKLRDQSNSVAACSCAKGAGEPTVSHCNDSAGSEIEDCGRASDRPLSSGEEFERRKQRMFNRIFETACSSYDDDVPKENKLEEGAEEEEQMEESGELTAEGNVTYKTHFQRKVDQLPIPGSLKKFLLFYRI